MEDGLKDVLFETQKQYTKSNELKDRIIILLIIALLLEGLFCFGGFVWYESQFDVKEEQTVDIDTEGDNANAQYIDGNQYNDDSKHYEGGAK